MLNCTSAQNYKTKDKSLLIALVTQIKLWFITEFLFTLCCLGKEDILSVFLTLLVCLGSRLVPSVRFSFLFKDKLHSSSLNHRHFLPCHNSRRRNSCCSSLSHLRPHTVPQSAPVWSQSWLNQNWWMLWLCNSTHTSLSWCILFDFF